MTITPIQELKNGNHPGVVPFDPSKAWGGYISIPAHEFKKFSGARITRLIFTIENVAYAFVPKEYRDRVEFISKMPDEGGEAGEWSYGWKYIP